MRIDRLRFRNFRNLTDGEIIPDKGINVIYGNNAQGKTNLLESVWLFTGGHSFRGNKDAELVRIDSEVKEAELEAEFFSEERNQEASIFIKNGRRSSRINGIDKSTGSALVGKLCAVIFSPEHLLLVKEGPQKRRNFIDAALCQTKPSYIKILSQYNRSLAQRNALLKSVSKNPELESTVSVWNDRIAYFGALTIKERFQYIEKLAPSVKEIYSGISREKEKIEIEYEINSVSSLSADINDEVSASEISALLGLALEKNLQTDLRLGFTSVGPHKDDIIFKLNGVSARTFGSQGQQRSVVLALKLAEAQILEKSIGEAPIILLDDVMSELDASRQDYLLNHLENRQVFITCCSPDTVSLMRTGERIYVDNGNVLCEDNTDAVSPDFGRTDISAEQ